MNKLMTKDVIESCPIHYIYGVKEETEYGTDVFIRESSIKEYENKLLSDIVRTKLNLEMIYENYYYIIKGIFDGNSIKDKTVNIKLINKDKIIFWFDRECLGRTLILEENLRKQSKFIETFLNSIHDCVFVKNLNGCYINCNNKFANKFGVEKEEILGKNDKEIFENIPIELKSLIKNDFRDKKSYCNDWIFNGEEFIFDDLVNVPLYNTNNEVECIISIVRDLSYQKAIENRLYLGEKLAFKVFDNSTDIVIIKDGKKTIYANDAIEKIYGINKKEAYLDNDYILKLNMIHKDDRSLLEGLESCDELLKKVRIIRKDNEEKTVLFKYNSISIDDLNKLRIIIIRDITENISEERELDKLKGEIFANLSHEFKTPVNLIYSIFQLLDFKFKESNCKLVKEYCEYLESGKKNIFRLMKLINNLIDSTKLENKSFNIEKKDEDIVSCVENIVQAAYDYISNEKVTIIFDTEEEEKIVSFDRTHIERILLNLISNSIKFNENEIAIEITLSFTDEYVHISVKDNGIGISKDKIDSLFSRFKIINNRFTKINEGSGMGLFIINELIRMHNGQIEVKSELGEGTEVNVKIPNIKIGNEEFEDVSITLLSERKRIESCRIELADIYL